MQTERAEHSAHREEQEGVHRGGDALAAHAFGGGPGRSAAQLVPRATRAQAPRGEWARRARPRAPAGRHS